MKTKIIILTIMVFSLALFVLSSCEQQQIVGGDKDEHGCIASAGYVWDNESQTCIRPWEKVCCGTYGFGANMTKCCEIYEFTNRLDCKNEPGSVGGGKEIVNNSFCKGSQAGNDTSHVANYTISETNASNNSQNHTGNANMANPASVYCINNGGVLETDGSQLGYCRLPNGHVCEEWAYFRGQCD